MRSSLKPADDLALLEPLAAAVVQMLPIEMMPLLSWPQPLQALLRGSVIEVSAYVTPEILMNLVFTFKLLGSKSDDSCTGDTTGPLRRLHSPESFRTKTPLRDTKAFRRSVRPRNHNTKEANNGPTSAWAAIPEGLYFWRPLRSYTPQPTLYIAGDPRQ